jgi:hypothetical protein
MLLRNIGLISTDHTMLHLMWDPELQRVMSVPNMNIWDIRLGSSQDHTAYYYYGY